MKFSYSSSGSGSCRGRKTETNIEQTKSLRPELNQGPWDYLTNSPAIPGNSLQSPAITTRPRRPIVITTGKIYNTYLRSRFLPFPSPQKGATSSASPSSRSSVMVLLTKYVSPRLITDSYAQTDSQLGFYAKYRKPSSASSDNMLTPRHSPRKRRHSHGLCPPHLRNRHHPRRPPPTHPPRLQPP